MPREPNSKLTTSQEVLTYLIGKLNELGIRIDGRKKIIKLMFLVEHYDPNKPSKLTARKIVGNKFVIYRYGVFSFGVRDDYLDLDEMGISTEKPTIAVREKDIINKIALTTAVKSQIDRVIDEFGSKSGFTLEIETLKMLGLNKSTKRNYYGADVRDFIQKMNSRNLPPVHS